MPRDLSKWKAFLVKDIAYGPTSRRYKGSHMMTFANHRSTYCLTRARLFRLDVSTPKTQYLVSQTDFDATRRRYGALLYRAWGCLRRVLLYGPNMGRISVSTLSRNLRHDKSAPRSRYRSLDQPLVRLCLDYTKHYLWHYYLSVLRAQQPTTEWHKY